MPLFYFHVLNGDPFPDLEGTDLVDASAARLEAVRAAGHMLSDAAKDICEGASWSMRVTDEADSDILNLRFLATAA